MTERTTVTEVNQIGVESTSGTAVAANKKLTSLSFDFGVKANVDAFRPSGSKVNTIHALGKEWTEGAISGEPCYTELQYIFASLLNYAAPVQIGATTAYTWTHASSATAADTIKSYTVERGSALLAEKVAYAVVSDFSLKGARDKIALSGTALARSLSEGITLTSSPTSLSLVPVLPKEVSVYFDTTSGGLGTTKLTRVLSWEWNMGGRFNPLWVVDAAQASWISHTETPPTAQVKLMVENDAAGAALRAYLRSGTTGYVRIEAVSGQNAGAATPYKLTIDSAVQVADIGTFADTDGIQAFELTFDVVYDPTWTHYTTVALINTATAL